MIFITLVPSIQANVYNMTPVTDDETIAVTAMVDAQLDISSPSVVLLEGSTGTIIYEKNKDEQLKPASITKIMTLLLIFEALDSGQIKLMDDVSVSEHAASMGGSQVYLEPYEVQNVDTMIKCISIASANDASVAMAEYIAGSEEEFVARMNERAKELGMNNTHFVNCCGLDTDNHYSSAYDVALMSRELIMNFPEISNYSTVWMDTIVHTTKKGRSEFGLTNTNKLVKFYNGITGLKTGSTSIAKYCLSATARRNNMDLIAVVLAAPDTKTRFLEASKLLNYGFANYSIYTDQNSDTEITPVRVVKGVNDLVLGKAGNDFSYLCSKGKTPDKIRKEVILYEEIPAPVAASDKIGDIIYYYENEKIGSVDILASQAVDKAGFKDCFIKVLKRYFLTK
jgi:D-alanyl-D-alanine carboxypeptidase (penicillin-binding protein 5/6)